MDKPDIVIVGAGVAGATLAAMLAPHGLRIVLIDAHTPPTWAEDAYDLRVLAVSPASQHVLTQAGVWQTIAAKRVSAYQHMHVWEKDNGSGALHFSAAEVNVPALGHIIENNLLVDALLAKLQTFDNVQCHFSTAVSKITWLPDQAQVELDNGQQLRAQLIVGADGLRSKVRELAEIDSNGWLYDQHAVVATVTHLTSHQNTAWQRFLSTGPLAFLPLVDGRSSIVWSTTPAQANALLACDEAAFCQQLSTAIAPHLGAITASSQRVRFPLQLHHAQSYTQPRCALIGDAAHSIHPLAGQGGNLGILDAAALAKVLLRAQQQQHDVGAHTVLRRYERARKTQNLRMAVVTDGLYRVFGTAQPLAGWLRGAGLAQVNQQTLLKQQLMQVALR